MLHDGSIVVEQEVLPVGAEAHNLVAVGVGQVVRISVERGQTVLDAALVLQDGIVGSSCHVALSPGALPAVGEVIVDAGSTHAALLGRHEDNTVGGASTIDGTRSGILQHLHALDIIGVHTLHTVLVGGHAVNDVEGIGVVDGADTADADHRLGAGLTRRRSDVDTGGHTLQGILGTQACLTGQVFRRNFGDGGCHNTLLLHTVTDHDNLVEQLGVLGNDDVHVVTGKHGLLTIAHISDFQLGTGGCVDGEIAVEIRNGGVRRALLHNRGTNHRLAVGINDGTREGLILCKCRYRQYDCQQQ